MRWRDGIAQKRQSADGEGCAGQNHPRQPLSGRDLQALRELAAREAEQVRGGGYRKYEGGNDYRKNGCGNSL